MKNSPKLIMWSVIAVAVLAFVAIYFKPEPAKKYDVITAPKNYLLCKENEQKTDPLGNIYTCIGEKWVYTGSVNEPKCLPARILSVYLTL